MSVRRSGLLWMPTLRRRVASVAAVVVLGSLLAAPRAVVAAPGGIAAEPDIAPRSVPVEKLEPRKREVPELPAFTPRPPVWPAATTVAVDLPAPAQADAAGPMATAARTVFAVGRPAATAESPASAGLSRAELEVLGQATAAKAGVNGVLFRVRRGDGGLSAARVRLGVDTSGFSGAFGGDWASRLRVVAYPGCLLTTPEAEGCATPVRAASSKLDTVTGRLSAEVEAAPALEASSSQRGDFAGLDGSESLGSPMVLAVTAGQSSDAGDFTKTPFSSSYEWSAGGSSGDFTWSYNMPVPPAPGGLEPEVGLGYSSGAVDGQTAGKNVQPGSVGEGWDLQAGGYIERSYRPCRDDLDNSPLYTQTTDLCWRKQNARLVWGGKSTELIQDDGVGNKWHMQDDDGELVQKYFGSSNGDEGDGQSTIGEYWAVTAQDGTKYFFGLETVPGNRQTNSTSTVRVRANHVGDECFSASAGYVESSCWQAYRWNLSYVVDVHGNAMAYFYQKEVQRSRYGASSVQSYDRASRLIRIEYGVRASVGFVGTPPAAVDFTWNGRCLASCGTETNPTEENWPDTPWDLYCATTEASCPNNPSPSFWTSNRLTKVTTKIRTGDSSNPNTVSVDEWAMEQLFPDTGNTTSPVLWLQEINRTGKAKTPNVTLPELRFGGTRLDQRALWNPSLAQHRKYRIDEVFTETGGHIGITYLGQDPNCQYGSATPDPDNNIRRCFPKLYRIDGDDTPIFSWWHKYIVLQVVESDDVGGSPPVVHDYAYTLASSSPAAQVLWGHDDGPAIWASPLEHRTWGSWRGYTDVTETVGPTAGPRTQTKRVFMRGLRWNWTDTGGDRDALVKNSLGEWVSDYLWTQGLVLEELRYATPNGQVLSKTLYQPQGWATGSRTVSTDWAKPNIFESVVGRTAHERTFTWLTAGAGSFRQTKTLYAWHPTYGYRTEVSELGDQGAVTTNDDRCTRTWYTGTITTNVYLVGFPNQTHVAGAACSVPLSSANTLSDTRFFYDGSLTHGAPLSLGNLTRTEQVGSYTSGNPNWVKTATAGYDAWGRVVAAGDAQDRVTETSYTQNPNNLLHTVKTTNPADHETTVTVDPAWGLPRIVSDPNGKVTTVQHDALGRVLKVWRDNRSTGTTANAEYIYTIDPAKLAAPHTQTKTLTQPGTDNTRISTFEIADGLLRPRQVQATAPDGKRTITDTRYDGRGLATKTSTFYNSGSGPTGTLYTFADTNIDSQTRTFYDGLGRTTDQELWSLNVFKWRTRTSYGGDRVSVDAPDGGTSTTSILDVRGRQTTLWQYTGASPTGIHEDTTYTYDKADRLTKVQDHAGNHWDYTYDLLGRRTQTVDPDAGTSTSTYDNAGQLITTTDGRGIKLWRKYDLLGRQTELRDGDAQDLGTGTLRASWTYDSIDKGQLTSSTRHTTAGQYTTTVTDYDDGYRPLSTTVTIPASELGAGNTTFTSTSTYHPDGSLATDVLPAVGGLPGETLTYGYSTAALPTTMTSVATTYVSATFYHYDNIVGQRYFGSEPKRVRVTNPVDAATRRLASSQLDTEIPATPNSWNNKSTTTYTYDQAGNVTSMAGKTNGSTDQIECFTYDYHRRLTEAWTEATSCTTNFKRTGADPYRLAWTYDVTGNRTTQKSWASSTLYSTATSHYDPPGPGGPHAVSKVVYTDHGARPDDTFAYNNGGYTTDRNINGVDQDLTWDAEGHLATTTQTGGTTTSYVYDADGNRLIRKVGSETTVYLGGTELRKATSTGPVNGTRYYTHNGATVAVRTTTGLRWLVPDHHGTNQISIDPNTLAMTRRRTLPFGETRGTPPAAWPGDKGFVGGTIDPTSLTHIGAREYDSTLGRFISVDPLVDVVNPQTLNAYAYGNNAPVIFSDPDGRAFTEWNDGENENAGHAPLETVAYSKPNKRDFKGGHKPNVKDDSADCVLFECFGEDDWDADEVAANVNTVFADRPDYQTSTAGLYTALQQACAMPTQKVPTCSNYVFAYLSGQHAAAVAEMTGDSGFAAAFAALGAGAAGVFQYPGKGGVAGGIWTPTKKLSSAGNALNHFRRHGSDFPDTQNALQYVRKATGWLNNPTATTITIRRTNGEIVRYDPKTEYFGVMTKGGVPKTFYIPNPAIHGYKTNLDYFNAQRF